MREFLLGPGEEQEPCRTLGDGTSEEDELSFNDDWDEEDLIALKRRSVVQMEQNLLETCDSSPIQPRSIRFRESGPESTLPGVEKILMERLLLRKEMRLRSMQERLLQQGQRLEEVEARLSAVEALPGFRAFLTMGGAATEARQLTGQGLGGLQRGGQMVGKVVRHLVLLLFYHLPLWLVHLLPPGLTIALANLAHRLSSLLAQRAENFSNQCNERQERQERQKEAKQESGGRRRGRR